MRTIWHASSGHACYTWLELFAGGGGVTTGLVNAGHRVAVAVEMDPIAANCHKANHPGTEVLVSDVRAVDIAALPKSINAIWGSPVCKTSSLARAGKDTARDDSTIGEAIIPYIECIKPEIVIIENVAAYRYHSSYFKLMACLIKQQYTIDVKIIHTENYGIPQARERLIIQARRGAIAWPAYSAPRTWYAALEDMIPTFKDDALANWQRKLWLPEHAANVPALVWGHYAFKKPGEVGRRLCVSHKDQPAYTITSSHNQLDKRIVLEDGSIKHVSIQATARLQTFPDGYIWPAKLTDAQEIIGNAVPCDFVKLLALGYVKDSEVAA